MAWAYYLADCQGVLAPVWSCSVFTDGLKVLDLLGIFIQIDLTVAVNWQRGLGMR